MKTQTSILKNLLLVLLCLVASTGFSQFSVNESIKLLDRDVALNLQRTFTDDGHITTGYSEDAGNPTLVNLVKTDGAGAVTWSNVYQMAGGPDQGNAVEQTSDGGYAVTGFTSNSGPGFAEAFLLKTDPAGNVMWAQTYPHINSAGVLASSEGTSLEQLPGDEYIICGSVRDPFFGGVDALVVHADPGGNAINKVAIDLGGNEIATSIKPLPFGGFAMCGIISYPGAFGRDMFVAILDPALNPIWTNIYGTPNDDAANSIEVRPGGNLLVVGETNAYTNGRYDILLMEIDPTGATLWSFIYGHKRDDYGVSVEELSTGRLAITGRTNSAPASTQVALLTMTDPAGNYLQNKVFGDLANAQSGHSIKEDPASGDLIIAGIWEDVPGSTTNQEIYLVRTDASATASCAYNRNFFSIPINMPYWTPPIGMTVMPMSNPIPALEAPLFSLVTDRCCSCSDIIADFVYSPVGFCAGTPVTFTNTSTCAATYKWFVNGTLVSTSTDIVYTFSSPGTYTVELRAKLPGCPAASKLITINVTCRMGALLSEEMFNAYPNPVADVLTVEALMENFEGPANMELYDLTGRLVQSEQVQISQGFTQRMDVSALPEGMYQLKLHYGSEVFTQSISVVR